MADSRRKRSEFNIMATRGLFDYNQLQQQLANAYRAQAGAATEAGKTVYDTTQRTQSILKNYANQAVKVLQPFNQAGQQSLKQLQDLLSGKPITSNVTRAATLADIQGLGVNVSAQQLQALGVSPGQAYAALTANADGIGALNADEFNQLLGSVGPAGNLINADAGLLERLRGAQEGQVTEQEIRHTPFSDPQAFYAQAADAGLQAYLKASSATTDDLLVQDAKLKEATLNDPFTRQLIDTSIGYGTKALEGSASAAGSLRSGRTVEDLFQLGQDTSLGFLQSEINNLRQQRLGYTGLALNSQQAAVGALSNTYGQQIQGLSGIYGIGANAAGAQAQALFGLGGQLAGQELTGAQALANAALARGGAAASLYTQLGQIDLQRQLDSYLFASPGGSSSLGGGGRLGGQPLGQSSFSNTVPVTYGNPNFPGYNTPQGSYTTRSIF